MQSKTLPLRPRQRAATVSLIAGLLVLAGCGSAHSSTSAPVCPGGQTACVSRSPRVKAGGPKALDANLIRSMARTNPTLSHVKLACPRPAAYPIKCRLAATEKVRGRSIPVKGTATVLGVDTGTRTYAYGLDYAPSR